MAWHCILDELDVPEVLENILEYLIEAQKWGQYCFWQNSEKGWG